jgi:hypothetical protein
VAFWATVAVVVGLVGYPLSFGPACWAASWNVGMPLNWMETLYWPIFRVSAVDVLEDDPKIHRSLYRYAKLFASEESVGIDVIFLRAGFDAIKDRPSRSGFT